MTKRSHPDLAAEQEFFDAALEHREVFRANLQRAPEMAAHPGAAVELRRRIGALGIADPDEGVAFGRIDAAGERWYVGRNAIWDGDNDPVVVNWQAPVAARFYTATPTDPHDLDARRVFRCDKNAILAIEDIVFREVQQAIIEARQPVLSDALLDELQTARSGELGDIVATIQAAQYAVISQPLEQLLIVQGGPGTGKTVVGLHRVSWLLYNRSDAVNGTDVLVVGPNRGFVRYIQGVLPSLGDDAIRQLPVTALGPSVRTGRVEPAAVRRLKGDRRMLRVVKRALENRQRLIEERIEFHVDSRTVSVLTTALVRRARQLANRPHNEVYQELRNALLDLISQAVRQPGRSTPPIGGETLRDVDNYLERSWPLLTPQAFVLELYSTRRQLQQAAHGILSDDEVEMLAVQRDVRLGAHEWSVDDIPILDAASRLLNGPPESYRYVVVDEAQDLSPMQLLCIRRRSRTGWMTVLGDLAQATSACAHDSWDELAEHLSRDGVPSNVETLEVGYRLPKEVHNVAMRLMPHIAPALIIPHAIRESGYEVETVQGDAEQLFEFAVDRARKLLGTGLIGLIAPLEHRDGIARALNDAGLTWAPELRPVTAPIVVLSADEAKGLEFDNVVVVEPSAIRRESAQGLRAVFVAITRPTTRLVIVHAEELPSELALLSPGSVQPRQPPAISEAPDLSHDVALAVARTLAEHARSTVTPALLPAVAREFARLMSQGER